MDALLVDNIPDPAAPYYLKVYEGTDFHLPWHAHDVYELTLIVHGTRMVGTRMDSFFPGDLVLLAPHLPHAWHNVRQNENEPVKAVTLFFRPHYPSAEFFNLPDNAAMADVLSQSALGLVLREPLRTAVGEQLQALERQAGHRKALGILQILATIADANQQEQSEQLQTILTPDHVTFRQRRSPRVQRVLNYIFDHLDEPLTSRDLGKAVGMHPSALGRLFRRSTGSSLIEFIHRARITRACRLLGDPSKSITEIAFEVGFQNLSHFNRIFRRLEGMSPSQKRVKARTPLPPYSGQDRMCATAL